MSLKEFQKSEDGLIHKAIRTISEDYDSLNETLKAQLRQVFTVERTIKSVTKMVQHLNKSTDKKSIFYIIYSQTHSQWFLIWPNATTDKFNTSVSSLFMTDTTSPDDDVMIKITLHNMSELIKKKSFPFIFQLRKLFTVVTKDYQSINDAVDYINQSPSPKSMFYIVFDVAKRDWYLLWPDSANNQFTNENKMMIKQRFYKLSQEIKQYYIKELSKIRSWSSLLSSAKAKQQKNKRYLQSLQLMAAKRLDDDQRLDIDSFKSKLPQQITTKTRGKLALLLEAYNQIRAVPPTSQASSRGSASAMTKQLMDEQRYKQLLKNNNPFAPTFELKMNTLCQVISYLGSTDGLDEKLKQAQKIISPYLPPLSPRYPQIKIQITDSSEWIEIIRNYLLQIKDKENFCNFIAQYPQEYEVENALLNKRSVHICQKSPVNGRVKNTLHTYNLTFLERIEEMNKFQEQLKGKCLSKYLDCFIQLYHIFTEPTLNIDDCRPQIDERCKEFASRLEIAQMQLDDELITLVSDRIKERPRLKPNLQRLMRQQHLRPQQQQQSKSTTTIQINNI
jgi:hypothetical protein